MRNPENPCKEFTIVLVFSFIKRFDYLNKGILKYVFSQMLFLYKQEDVGVDLFPIPVNKLFKAISIATDELVYKFIVSQINVIQHYLLFEFKSKVEL